MNLLEHFKKIKIFVFDIDGVLTDGTVLVISGDDQVRRMNIKDGFALQMAVLKGYHLFIISGGSSEAVKDRLARLGVNNVFMSVKNKKHFLSELMKKYNLQWEEVLFMGDDLPDLELMHVVGLSTCPADAIAEVRDVVKYVSPLNGGFGCARDVIEKVLKQNDHWHFEPSIASH